MAKVIVLHLADAFSGATDIKVLTHNDTLEDRLTRLMLNGTVSSVYDNTAGIRWDWVIEELEIKNI